MVATAIPLRRSVEYVGETGAGVLASCVEPADDVRGCVVVCPSLFNDVVKNLRREVLLADRLAASGVATIRFDYRGVANSGVDGFDVSLVSMAEDLRSVLDATRSRYGDVAVGFVATRVGALVAAGVSADAPLVLWEPVLEAKRYLREALRAVLMSGVVRDTREPATRADLLHHLDEEGWLDLLGYRLTAPLLDELEAVDLAARFKPPPSAALLVQFSKRTSPSPGLEQLAARLRDHCVDVGLDSAGFDESWWFGEDIHRLGDPAVYAARLLDLTVGWLVRCLEGVVG